MASATSFYDFKPKNGRGEPYDLGKLRNKVVLVVNTASKCGFTEQFEGLENLYQKIGKQGEFRDQFVILAFPCNQFASQDPGDNATIQAFCTSKFNVTFPVMSKVNVNFSNTDPLFGWLKKETPYFMGISTVRWNFEKWLIGRDGKVIDRWSSKPTPESLEGDVLKALRAGK